MNWEKSKSLTPLKRDFIKAFFSKCDQFFLTGGSALSIFYLDHRLSYDLDFFTLEKINWHLVENIILDIAETISSNCRKISTSDLFCRYELTRNNDREIIDFIIEKVPQIENIKNRFGNVQVDTIREIGINKICTLLGRCELKDIIDLYFLKKSGFDIINNLAEARRKDAGLEPAILSYLLGQINIEKMPDYLIKKVKKIEIEKFINYLQDTLSDISFPDEE